MMETVIPNLYASPSHALSFALSTHVRAFLLQRKQGNLLVYSADTVADDPRAIEALGGVSRHYLNHWHEAGFGCDRVAGAVKSPIFCHENERHSVSKTCDVAETFSRRHFVGDDFEAIPTPGHTSGATAFLWDSGHHRCLFTGDTVYLHEGDWIAAVLESSDREAYIESLELIKGLDFDVLVPWVATAGQPFLAVTEKSDAGAASTPSWSGYVRAPTTDPSAFGSPNPMRLHLLFSARPTGPEGIGCQTFSSRCSRSQELITR